MSATRLVRGALLAVSVGACGKGAPAEVEACQALCDELVSACGYAAYPDYDSCLLGCAYDAEQGADVDAERTCIEQAQCDTFAVVDCAREHGP